MASSKKTFYRPSAGQRVRRRTIQLVPTSGHCTSLQTVYLRRIMAVPLNRLERNPSQPRAPADEEKLDELIPAILQEGLIQPIAVRLTSESSHQIVARLSTPLRESPGDT